MMKMSITTDAWVSHCATVLGLIAAASVISAIILTMMSLPVPGVIIGLGLISAAGLARLLISPLNQRWFE